MNRQVWLITGCTSGIGEALAKAVLARGDLLIATARAPIDRLTALKDAGATTLELDSTASPEVVADVASKAVEAYGRIDNLVLNAGYAHAGLAETVTPEAWEKQLGVNFFGIATLVSAILPHMRSRRSGRIVFSNSVFGHISQAGSSPYAVAKHALHAYSKTLSLEVKHLNIKVVSLDIGYILTPFFESAQVEPCTVEGYEPALTVLGAALASIPGNQPGDVNRCAEAIITATVSAKKNFSIVPIGSDALLTVRKYAELLNEQCDEWEAVAKSADRDGPKRGFFENVPHYCHFD